MSKLLIKFEFDGGYDFPHKGWFVLTAEEWEQFKAKAHTKNPKLIHMDYHDHLPIYWHGPENYLNHFKVQEISEEELQVLDKLFKADYITDYILAPKILFFGSEQAWSWVFDE